MPADCSLDQSSSEIRLDTRASSPSFLPSFAGENQRRVLLLAECLLERDLLPDWLIRIGIRRLLRQRLREEDMGDVERQHDRRMGFIRQLKDSPVAIETQAANRQHYEVPSRF